MSRLQSIFAIAASSVFVALSLSALVAIINAATVYRSQSANGGNELGRDFFQSHVFPPHQNCYGEMVDNRLDHVLAELDQRDLDRDYTLWAGTVADAEDAATDALACMPTNGVYWVKLAMLRQSQVEIGSEIALLIDTSQIYAPVELDVIGARLALIDRVSAPTFEIVRRSFEKDRTLICSERYRWAEKLMPRPSTETVRRIGARRTGSWC